MAPTQSSEAVSPNGSYRVLVIGLGSFAFGKERRAVNFFRHCHSRIPVFLISKWEEGDVSRLLQENGFLFSHATFGYLGRRRLKWTLINAMRMPSLFLQVIRTFRDIRAQEIAIFDVHAFVNAFPAIEFLRLFCGARISFYLGDIPADSAPNHLLARLINFERRPVVAISEAVRRGLQAIGVEPTLISVVRNGVDLLQYGGHDSTKLKARLGWPKESIIFGYAGQITERKGIEDLIHAAALVYSEEPRCRFAIFGRFHEQNAFHCALREQVNRAGLTEIVYFAGYSQNMPSVYSSIDVQVMPSRHEEALGNVAIEAAAAGIPIIASNTGGISETVLHGETGFLVEKQKPSEIANYILYLARNEHVRRGIGIAARRRAEEQFDIRKNAKVIEELIFGSSDSERRA